MLAKRVIPTILMKNGLLVKGEQFRSDRVVGNALQAARIHAMRGVDEILMLDVTATKEGREPDYAMVEQLTSTATVPVTVGGGITRVEHVRNLLASGADKVCVSSSKSVKLIKGISDKFGNQVLVLAVDLTDAFKKSAGLVAEAYASLPCGEILLQNKDRDGTMQGYNLTQIKAAAEQMKIPLIASSGCASYADMHSAILMGADAVAAGALFQFTNATPKGAVEYLHEQGVEVRL